MFHFFRGHHRLHHEHHHHQRGGGRGPKMFDAGAMRYVVLQLIADKPRHGYEIIKELETLTGGSYSPSPGAIYPLLSMMADMGHVDIVKDGNKKLYSVLPEGQQFLDENRNMVDAYMARLVENARGKTGGFAHPDACPERRRHHPRPRPECQPRARRRNSRYPQARHQRH